MLSRERGHPYRLIMDAHLIELYFATVTRPLCHPFIPARSNERRHQQDQVADEPPNQGKPGQQRRLSQREASLPKEREWSASLTAPHCSVVHCRPEKARRTPSPTRTLPVSQGMSFAARERRFSQVPNRLASKATLVSTPVGQNKQYSSCYFANRNSKPMPSCNISPFANRLWDTMASMASLV